MKTKYSPCHTDNGDTVIEYIDENTIKVDGEEFQFDEESVVWLDVAELTAFKILEARRVDGELYLTIRRYYTQLAQPEWDTGEYHDIKG